jgi:hypothetical protein
MALTRNDKIIAVIFSVVLFGSIFGYVFIYPILKYDGPSWPTIDNPSKLLQESKVLLRDYPEIIKDVNWPESVKNLSPVGVTGHKNFVDITISGGGIGPANGYLVYPDGRSNSTEPYGYIIKDLISPGVFKYLTKE